MNLISWNVNGIRACMTKGFEEFFNEIDADIFCIQETKCQEGQIELNFDGYTSYWNSAEKKGYSGTAIFTKIQPLNVTYGIGIEKHIRKFRLKLNYGETEKIFQQYKEHLSVRKP